MDAFVRWHGRHDHAETVLGSEDRVMRPRMGRPGHTGDAALADRLGGPSPVWITLLRSARRWVIAGFAEAESMPQPRSSGRPAQAKRAISLIKIRYLEDVREPRRRRLRSDRHALPFRPAHPWCAAASRAPRRAARTASLAPAPRRTWIPNLIHSLNRVTPRHQVIATPKPNPAATR